VGGGAARALTRALPLDPHLRQHPRHRARLGPEAIATIEQAQPTQLLPVAINVAMAEAVFAEAGADGARRWGTASLLQSFDGFFKPIFLGLTRLVGE
jgi:hypothetical protein